MAVGGTMTAGRGVGGWAPFWIASAAAFRFCPITVAASRSICARDAGCTMKVMSFGSTEFPPVWSPCSDPTTYHFTGLSVTVRMASSIACVSPVVPCPSATSTPLAPTTIRLTVVKFGG